MSTIKNGEIAVTNNNHTKFNIPIQLFFGLANLNEKYISHHMGPLELNVKFQKIYNDNLGNIYGEDMKHMFGSNNEIKYEIQEPVLNECVIPSREEKYIQQKNELYNNIKTKKKFEIKLKERKNAVQEDISLCHELLKILYDCVIEFDQLDTYVFGELYRNHKYRNISENDKNIIKDILRGDGTAKLSNSKLYHFIDERINRYRYKKIINFKKNKEFGKHNNSLKMRSKNNDFPISSTVVKRQIYDNPSLKNNYEKYFPANEKKIYETILENMYKCDITQLEKNKIIEFFCSNIVILSIINNLHVYVDYCHDIIKRLTEYPHMILYDEVIGFKKTHKKIMKCNETDLENIEWNIDNNGRKIFHEIYMVNTYGLMRGYSYYNEEISHCIGFAICKGEKYNVIPIYDERIDMYNLGKGTVENHEKQYLEKIDN